ncbi:hypothetical protein, partial [Burkholderia vietnamiensis]|uniref:hypothetical protein n=1 Tax=Burkholderia vietnamiensis TaxID=60552 RepID=UPI001CF1569D
MNDSLARGVLERRRRRAAGASCAGPAAPRAAERLETVSKRPRGAVNFRGELLTSGIGTTETEEMAKPIIDDELWTL